MEKATHLVSFNSRYFDTFTYRKPTARMNTAPTDKGRYKARVKFINEEQESIFLVDVCGYELSVHETYLDILEVYETPAEPEPAEPVEEVDEPVAEVDEPIIQLSTEDSLAFIEALEEAEVSGENLIFKEVSGDKPRSVSAQMTFAVPYGSESANDSEFEFPSAFDTQVQGGHYKNKGIQPLEFIMANDLPFCEANVVKYISRHKDKNGKFDIKKVMHYCQFILEKEYGVKSVVRFDDEVN